MKVEINDLTVRYRDGDHALLALDRVALTLEPGRVTALVGESGSGKTTLGKALMGLLPENAEIRGNILLGGDEIVGLDEASMNELRWIQGGHGVSKRRGEPESRVSPDRPGGGTSDPKGRGGPQGREDRSEGTPLPDGTCPRTRGPLPP